MPKKKIYFLSLLPFLYNKSFFNLHVLLLLQKVPLFAGGLV